MEHDGEYVAEAMTFPLGEPKRIPPCPWIVTSNLFDDEVCAVLRWRIWRSCAAPMLVLTWYGPGPNDVKTAIEHVSGVPWSDVEPLHQYLAKGLGHLLKRGRPGNEYETDPYIRAMVGDALALKRKHPDLRWRNIAGRLGVDERTLRRWREHFRTP